MRAMLMMDPHALNLMVYWIALLWDCLHGVLYKPGAAGGPQPRRRHQRQSNNSVHSTQTVRAQTTSPSARCSGHRAKHRGTRESCAHYVRFFLPAGSMVQMCAMRPHCCEPAAAAAASTTRSLWFRTLFIYAIARVRMPRSLSLTLIYLQ